VHPQTGALVTPSEAADILRSQIRARNVVLILGAGVSMASSRAAKSWTQLILSGAEKVVSLDQAPRPDWFGSVKSRLEPPTDPYYLTEAASDVVRVLRGSGHYERWLTDEFERQRVDSPELFNSIQGLSMPILTTNYDTLIEDTLKLQSVPPTNPSLLLRVAAGDYSGIGHIHGVWTDPATCVLTQSDYALISQDHGSGTIHRALSLTRSLVYIGFGAGVSDANFEAVHNWANERLGATSNTHYLLCRDSELDAFSRTLPPDITAVPYGPDYAALPAFIDSLNRTKSSLTPVIPPTFARESALRAIKERVDDDSLLVRFAEPRALGNINLIPPSLIPVPPEAFVRRDPAGNSKAKRLVPHEISVEAETILVVGGELSGVSSALQWMLVDRSDKNADEVPLYIDARRLKPNRKNALEYEIRQRASAAGIVASPNGPLPLLSLAIDNLDHCSQRNLERIVQDLRTLESPHAWLGCRQGSENNIVETFASLNFQVQTIYMGTLTKRDIGHLAELGDFPSPATLANRTSAVLQQEHLPRTAHSVSLLLSVLARGERTEPLARVTDLIEEYVGLLMTLSGESRSAGDALTAADLDAVCQEVSKRLCHERIGDLPLQEFFTLVEEYFNSVLIPVKPMDVLDRLEQSRLLGTFGGRIGFRQDSFLFFYAAKAAVIDAEFAAYIKSFIVLFAPIIKYYTAAVRGDGDVLLRWLEVFANIDRSQLLGGAFVDSPPLRKPMTLEEFEGRVERSRSTSPELPKSEELDDDYDYDAERGIEPFPTDLEEEPSGIFLQLTVLALGSKVLSQSDQVRDPELRVAMLRELLRGHADLVDLIEQDPSFEELIASFGTDGSMEPEAELELRQTISEFLPSLVGAGLLGGGLASSRLRQSIKNLLGDKEADIDNKVMCMAAVLALVLHTDDYGNQLCQLYARAGHSRFVRTAVHQLAEIDYLASIEDPHGSGLEDFLVDAMADSVSTDGQAERTRVKARARQLLQTRRKTRAIRAAGSHPQIEAGEDSDDS
jgi:hypothetical protein